MVSTEALAIMKGMWVAGTSGRADDDAKRDPVKFNERQRRRQLIFCCDKYAPPTQLLRSTVEARASAQVLKANISFGSPKHTARRRIQELEKTPIAYAR